MNLEMTKGFPENFLWGGAIAANQAEGSSRAAMKRSQMKKACATMTR